jgi:hydroxymethylpyrimidine kinase / phosphomethylpyrimidine kinase / thiamine-phosphate diphosphorylase
MKPYVGVIAGSDSSGGAGIACDIRVLESLNATVALAITATTAQSPSGLLDLGLVDRASLLFQLEALSHFPLGALKIGMRGDLSASDLEKFSVPKVWDPVLGTSSGFDLESSMEKARSLIPAVDLITPNLPEAERLLERPILNSSDREEAAQALMALGARAVLIKGGHASSDYASDLFWDSQGNFWIHSQRHPKSPRGTGCALASLIAVHLAKGLSLREAVVLSKGYLSRAIKEESSVSGAALEFSSFPWITNESNPTPLQFPRLREPIGFYPIVDRAEWVEKFAKIGARTIQLRIKDLTGERLSSEIQAALSLASRFDLQLFINDYWQLALQLGGPSNLGVHLGQEDLFTADLVSLKKNKICLGVSTHNYEELARALALGPSYIALGPIFPTKLKEMKFGPQGPGRISEWKRLTDCPVVAIGGITVETAGEIRKSGADGVAVITDLFQSPDPIARARQYLELLQA